MAFSLGSIFVELAVNHGQFLSGFSEAGLASRKFQREFSGAFAEIGDIAAKALAPFGEFGTRIGQTLSDVGRFGAGAVGQMGALGGAMGVIGSVGAIAAGAVIALDAGAIGLALHAAEAAAKIYEMSQRTGVSVEALSGFSFVAKQAGVDQEVMVKGLEKLNKAAFAAGTAPAGAINAFTRLAVSVKDSAGNFRNTQDILTDIADKFVKMPDGVTKTALAIQLFGRGGAALIPVLNEGKQGISEMLETADRLGVVISGATAESSHKLEQNFGQLKAAAEGFSNHLLTALLPALLLVSQRMVDFLKAPDVQKDLALIVSGLAGLVKFSFAAGDAFLHTFDQIGILLQKTGEYIIGIFNAVGAGLEAIFKAGTGDFSGAKASLQAGLAGLHNPLTSFVADSKKTWGDYANFIRGLNAPLAPGKGPAGPDKGAGPKEKDDTTLGRIEERIKALKQEAADWQVVAGAGTQAESLIAEAVKKGNAEFGKLQELAAKDKTGASQAFVLKNEELIKSSAAVGVYGAAIKSITGDLDKQNIKFSEQSKSALELAGAYAQGGAAIAKAAIGQQLTNERAKAESLTEAYDKLRVQSEAYAAAKARLGGAAGPLQVAPVSAEELAILKRGADQAASSLAEMERRASQAASDKLSLELAKEAEEFGVMKPRIDALNSAYLQNENAVRAAKIEVGLYKWEQDQLSKGVAVTAAQKDTYRKILTDADTEAYQGSLRQMAAQFSLNRMYDDEITKLQRVREVLQENGQSTLLIDAKLFDAQQNLTRQWDQAAFAAGSFGERTHAVLNEIVLMGQDAGKKIAEAFLSAYDSATGALAKLLTGQKANFKQMFQSLAESITKAEIQKVGGSILQSLGIKLPGQKADGSSSNPFYVIMAGGIGGKGAASPSFNLGGLFGAGKDGFFSQVAGLFSSGKSSGVGGFGDALNFGSNVAMLAGGGDFSAGRAVIVGEHGPELAVPKSAGTIIPNDAAFGKRHQTSITNNWNGFKDTDNMRRSVAQTLAYQHRMVSIAYGRS